jgi:CubicO group peptidase (beta-lactamase class C family)
MNADGGQPWPPLASAPRSDRYLIMHRCHLVTCRHAPLVALLAFALSACGLFDSTPEIVGCTTQYAGAEQGAALQLAGHSVVDAAFIVRVDGATVCRVFFGSYGPATRVPTASAAKWLTAATILGVVDRGALRLDTPASELFPTASAATSVATVSEMLSHTSGLLWFSRCMGRSGYTLQSCAQQILESDLQFDPGTAFYYAGPPFTVAGAMAERALGMTWAQIFSRTIAGPLGLSNTTYGDSANPALSEGDVVSTVDDYARFAQMVLDQGRYGTNQVLSQSAIAQMRHNWTAGLPIAGSPRGDIPYGLGVWLDAVDADGIGTVISSPGAGGFVPVVDFGRRVVLVFEAYDDVNRVWPALTAVLDSVRAVIDRGS